MHLKLTKEELAKILEKFIESECFGIMGVKKVTIKNIQVTSRGAFAFEVVPRESHAL